MEHRNYERELKYLIAAGSVPSMNEILDVFYGQYRLIETRPKRKHEAYYDDMVLTLIKRGDVIRGSTHLNGSEPFFHFMLKKDASDPRKPYVSKYEYGSGQYPDARAFALAMKISETICLEPVLYAEMTRETAVIEKDNLRLLISYDDVYYFRYPSSDRIRERMLEIEDWTTPNTISNAEQREDKHLITANDMLLHNLPLQLIRHSKPYRGAVLVGLI